MAAICGEAAKAAPARLGLLAQIVAGECFQFISMAAELGVRGPGRIVRPRSADRAACGPMQDQMGYRVLSTVEDETSGVGSEPTKVTSVIVDKALHIATMTAGGRAVTTRGRASLASDRWLRPLCMNSPSTAQRKSRSSRSAAPLSRRPARLIGEVVTDHDVHRPGR
jgi:hypothetical protein